MERIKFNTFIAYLVLVIVLVTTSVVGLYIVNKFKKDQPPQVVIEPKPSEYPDYDAIRGKNPDPDIRKALITNDCPQEGCKSDRPATQELNAIDKKYKVKGRFARAYLYTEAIVDYGRPLTAWDDIYFKINGFGGHLIKDENLLPVPPGEISIYLYDFKSISYYPTINDKEKRENRHNNINLSFLFQDSIMLDIEVFISSDRPGRIMKEITIYYECYEGSNCNIEEIRKN